MSNRDTLWIALTLVERDHLLTLLADAVERGDYYGNRDQYWKRHARIITKLTTAFADNELRVQLLSALDPVVDARNSEEPK